MLKISAPDFGHCLEDKATQTASDSSQLLTSTNPNIHTVTIGQSRIVACPDINWRTDLTDWLSLMTS